MHEKRGNRSGILRGFKGVLLVVAAGPPHIAALWRRQRGHKGGDLANDWWYSVDGDEGVLHVVGCCSWWCGGARWCVGVMGWIGKMENVVVSGDRVRGFLAGKGEGSRENPSEKMEDRRTDGGRRKFSGGRRGQCGWGNMETRGRG
ncbi:hypothetical protein Tco_0098168 [Tanacetum coccineum]